jgi:GNAT superfamily N-acetyltransferase
MMVMATSERPLGDQKGPVLVRPATADDLSDLLRLYQQLGESRPSALPADSDKAKSLMEVIAALPGRQLLVAEVGPKVLGTADLLIVPNLTHGGAPWAVVENVVVEEGAQRRGVGRALMEDVVRRCTDASCYKVQLLSNKRRSQAHQFYRSVGFEAIAEGFRRYLA